MNSPRPFLTQPRLRRAVLWLMTLLSWIAAMLPGDRANARHRRQRGAFSLAQISRWVGNLMMARALDMLPDTHPTDFQYWRRDFNAPLPHFRRTLLGAKLRRTLTHKNPAMCIARLIAVLRDLDAYAGRLADRVRHCLGRVLCAVMTMPPSRSIRVLHHDQNLAFVDSS